ncbi:MAG: hypothetical protein H6888_14545 [Nitratireductor sp.]|nr:hypothetical protein [Nitratireductor sp.]
MADFEGLILKALASQNATDPAVRQHVYQSSRNALERMLAKNAGLTAEAIETNRQSLESSIGRIETAFQMETERVSQARAAEAAQTYAPPPAEEPEPAAETVSPVPKPEYAEPVDASAGHAYQAHESVADEQPAEPEWQAEPAPQPTMPPQPAIPPEPVHSGAPDPEDLAQEPPAANGQEEDAQPDHVQREQWQAPSPPLSNETLQAPQPRPATAAPSRPEPQQEVQREPQPEHPAQPYIPPEPEWPAQTAPEETGDIVHGAIEDTQVPEASNQPGQAQAADEDIFDDDWGALFAPDGSSEFDIPLPEIPDTPQPAPSSHAGQGYAPAQQPLPPVSGERRQASQPQPPASTTDPNHARQARVEPQMDAGIAAPNARVEPQATGYHVEQEQVRYQESAPYAEGAYGDAGYTNPQGHEGYAAPQADAYPVYKRKHPLLRRLWPIALAIAVILVILWLLYALLSNMDEGSRNATSAANGTNPADARQDTSDGSFYITLLEPTDLSALTTAGRGSAELVNEQNRDILRIQSLRENGAKDEIAQPILLKLNPGVIKQIVGKEVTVEIRAKSGSSGPATFAIECSVDGANACGRKRFRVGLQPEDIVFALRPANGFKANSEAWLAINTDVTSAADISGAGEVIDIIYSRIRVSDR